jgi:hypothetical protein
VFIAGFVIHVTLKFPRMVTGLRSRSLRRELRTPLAETKPEELDAAEPAGESLRATHPRAPTISRRGLLAAIGGASLTLAGLVVGQSIGGLARRTSLFGPRGLSATAPHYLPVNRTAASIGLTAEDVGPGYRLTLIGARTVILTQAQLLRLPQQAVELPIACVEGWSVAARWTGVRLADLARLAGMPEPAGAQVDSIQQVGAFKSAVLSAGQVADPQSLLAVTVNGHVLPWDHGYPARTIIPNAPGVHNTKWVSKITFLKQV